MMMVCTITSYTILVFALYIMYIINYFLLLYYQSHNPTSIIIIHHNTLYLFSYSSSSLPTLSSRIITNHWMKARGTAVAPPHRLPSRHYSPSPAHRTDVNQNNLRHVASCGDRKRLVHQARYSSGGILPSVVGQGSCFSNHHATLGRDKWTQQQHR